MLRTERPRLTDVQIDPRQAQFASRDMLLAVAPPPQTQWIPLSGWPNWLIPAYRSGGHKPEVRLLEEDVER